MATVDLDSIMVAKPQRENGAPQTPLFSQYDWHGSILIGNISGELPNVRAAAARSTSLVQQKQIYVHADGNPAELYQVVNNDGILIGAVLCLATGLVVGYAIVELGGEMQIPYVVQQDDQGFFCLVVDFSRPSKLLLLKDEHNQTIEFSTMLSRNISTLADGIAELGQSLDAIFEEWRRLENERIAIRSEISDLKKRLNDEQVLLMHTRTNLEQQLQSATDRLSVVDTDERKFKAAYERTLRQYHVLFLNKLKNEHVSAEDDDRIRALTKSLNDMLHHMKVEAGNAFGLSARAKNKCHPVEFSAYVLAIRQGQRRAFP